MNDLFKGFEQLLELAQTLEEKAKNGELNNAVQTEVQINGRRLSSIPRRTASSSVGVSNVGVNPIGKASAQSEPSPKSTNADPVDDPTIVPPPASEGFGQTSIGGLSDTLRELRELVELPLKRPELLDRMGLEPARGILLVGPPGTGKTLTARTIAADLQVNYIAIAGPEIMGKYYGEAETKLRSVFEKAAAAAPCIIFIDEIDSLAPDRNKVEGEVEKRIVAQLLTLMDGFAHTDGVMVLAATNRPDHLDPALRRPGRFDREIQYRVPDRTGRLEILEILTRSMPLSNDVNLDRVADLAVGMVGADLKAVTQKAAYLGLRRQVPSLNDAIPDDLFITQEDFVLALREIKPSVLRSVEVESPNIAWDDIGGLTDIKQTLQESVEGALLYPDLYTQTGARAPRGVLLWGPPGTGKTLLAKAIASQSKANFIAVNGPELMSRWVGSAEQSVRELFNKARQASPCVIFIDEIDTLAPARGQFSGDSGVSDRVVGQLLTELDGLHDSGTVILVAATNRPDALDPALLRSGRLDLQLKVDLPDRQSRLSILQVHNSDRPLDGVNLTEFAAQTEGWNGADLALFSNQAALRSVRRYRAALVDGILVDGITDDVKAIVITQADFDLAYSAIVTQRESSAQRESHSLH